MKLPKRIADILKRKQAFIDRQRTLMELSVVKLQSQLLSDIISELVPSLDIKNGMIVDNAKNYRLLSVLDKTYKDFRKLSNQTIFDQITAGTATISAHSVEYFTVMLADDLPGRFDRITAKANKLINLKLGLDGGKLTRGGFLQSFFDSNTIGTELKNMTSKAVTSNVDMKDYVKMLRDYINGVPKIVIKDGVKVTVQTGAMERQFQRFAYDIYQQYDAAINLMLGNELGFKYFIYQGGLIEDSRDFCAAHNNKVWSVLESEIWGEWTPSQGEYPVGYEVKAKDIYSVPSYLGYAGYDPLIDRGGYNCRHALGWISDDIALKMRPGLK